MPRPHEPPPTLRVDLHAHTRHSPDAVMSVAELLERAEAAGLDRIAVTDHGTIEGALEAQQLDPERVIVGEEIRCRCRTELIGLFLRGAIPDHLPLEEVVERIRDQGGVIYAPHPFAYAWRPAWRAGRALGVADVVEAFNARAFLPAWNRLARSAARRRGLPVGAGSDAHFPAEVGRAYAELPAFGDARRFLEVVGAARPVGVSTTSPGYLVASSGLKAWRLTMEGRNRVGGSWAAPRTAPLDR